EDVPGRVAQAMDFDHARSILKLAYRPTWRGRDEIGEDRGIVDEHGLPNDCECRGHGCSVVRLYRAADFRGAVDDLCRPASAVAIDLPAYSNDHAALQILRRSVAVVVDRDLGVVVAEFHAVHDDAALSHDADGDSVRGVGIAGDAGAACAAAAGGEQRGERCKYSDS